MDIWHWVNQTYQQLIKDQQHQLAEHIYQISSLTCDDEHQKVDALYPVALNLAKQTNNPWLEVFFRHWHLQSNVLRRHHGAQMLPEAIDLLHFCSQQSTKDCPQSICAVQDLASCYGCTDGPGYTQERIAVCDETLARITPAWPCFVCISSEKNSALFDAKQYQQVIDNIQQQRQQMLMANANDNPQSVLCFSEAKAYLRLNQLDKALAIAQSAQNDAGGLSFERQKKCLIALIYAHRGEIDKALAVFPPFEQIILAQSYSGYFCEIFYIIGMQQSRYNHCGINQKYNQLICQLAATGCIRETINYSYWQGLLSLARDDLFTTSIVIERIKQNLPKLNKDLGASEKLAKLTMLFERQQQKLNHSNNPVLECLGKHQSLNECATDFNLTELAGAYHYDKIDYKHHHSLLNHYALALLDNGYDQQAINLIEDIATKNPHDSELFNCYSQILLQTNQLELFDQFYQHINVATLPHDQQIDYHFWRTRRYRNADQQHYQDALLQLLTLNPDDIPSRINLSWLYYQSNQFEQALEHYNIVIAATKDNSDNHWDRIMIATAAKDWQSVRQSCQALDIALEDEQGVIDENWGLILVEYPYQEPIELIALRTGPVSAKILGFCQLSAGQKINDEIIFEPCQLNQLTEQDEQGTLTDQQGRYYPLFRHSKTTAHSDMFFFTIDGVFPGQSAWETLKAHLLDIDGCVSLRSGEKYQLQLQQQGDWHQAFYVYVAVPKQTDFIALHQQLTHYSQQASHPFIWPLLAQHIATLTGDSSPLQAQAQIESDYGIEPE